MKRAGFALGVVVAALLLLSAGEAWAGGGLASPPFTPKVIGPTFQAVILLDPHNDAVSLYGGVVCGNAYSAPYPCTTTAKEATIWIGSTSTSGNPHGQITSQARFHIPPSFALSFGCDLTLTNQRFLFTQANQRNFTDWVPGVVWESLFAPFGVTPIVAPVGMQPGIPAITAISSARCIADPDNPATADGGSDLPGLLLMNVTIQFLVPAGP